MCLCVYVCALMHVPVDFHVSLCDRVAPILVSEFLLPSPVAPCVDIPLGRQTPNFFQV